MVIPARDAAPLLPRALRSALQQEWAPLEILVVDDGSSDDTRRVAESFGAPVRVLHQAPAGPAAARNLGILSARGTHIAFLDADDEWRREHLARAANAFAAESTLHWFSAAFEKHERDGRVWKPRPEATRLIDGRYFEDYLEAAQSWTCYTPTMVVRRETLLRIGLFDPSLPTGEDIDLWLRIALEHPRIGYCPEATVIIWSTPGSLVTRGLFDLAAAQRLAQRFEHSAATHGRLHDPCFRSYLIRWMTHFLRDALRAGDRGATGWVIERFGPELPFRWRLLARITQTIPPPLWSAITRVWISSRPMRARLWTWPSRN
ncbi:MAG: glycosyltransferase family A protein [Myxococcota bacterium]